MPMIVTSRPRSRQPAHALALNGADPAARLLVGLFAPWSRTDAVTGAPLSGWTGLDAIGAAIGGVAAIGAGSNYITGPAGYGRWAGKAVWGLILTFRLRSTSQTNTYVIRQGIGGGEQASLIYGYASQQFELYSGGFSGTDPRTGSQIAVADTQPHTLAYVADGTRTRGLLDGRIVTDVAATTTYLGGGGEPSTHLMAVNGVAYCAIEIYALGFWAGAVPPVEDVREATRNPWRMFAPVRRLVFFSAGGGVYDVALSESASASDSLGASGALTSALAEVASAADVVSAAAAFAAAMSEAATAGDSSAGSTVRAGALGEAAAVGDALTASATLAGSISEAVTASDVISSSGALLAALSEAASAADAIDGSVGAATYSATLAEAASAGDAWSSAAVIAGEIVEAVTAGDTVASIATMAAAITEAASAADQVSSAATMAAAISEAVTAADAWSGSVGAAVLTASITEAVTAGDVFAALELLARFGVRGARGVSVQANARRAQLQRSVRRN
jgi:hypothetical protein